MCGRFTRYLPLLVRDSAALQADTPAETGRNDAPAYNVAPTDPLPFVTAGENGAHKLREGRWWLVPWWAKEMPKAMFNARFETADTSGAFKDAFASTRCLIPADGFYEWTKSPADGGKEPWHIFLPEHQPFSFAGLWAYNRKLDITSCTIITQAAGEPMRQIHDRQPVILDPAAYDSWLDPATPVAAAKDLLLANLDGDLQLHQRRPHSQQREKPGRRLHRADKSALT
jgi:putative SOS response-associated peptidase YedK